MSKKEKLLLLQLILEDIRGNWAFKQEERVQCALELAEELKGIDSIDILFSTIKAYDFYDGRYFRSDYPYGYYEMDKLHGLNRTFNDKSEAFKSKAKQILTYPENRFEDWD